MYSHSHRSFHRYLQVSDAFHDASEKLTRYEKIVFQSCKPRLQGPCLQGPSCACGEATGVPRFTDLASPIEIDRTSLPIRKQKGFDCRRSPNTSSFPCSLSIALFACLRASFFLPGFPLLYALYAFHGDHSAEGGNGYHIRSCLGHGLDRSGRRFS